jgi:hypothetical protein
MCGKNVDVKPEVVVNDEDDNILLLQPEEVRLADLVKDVQRMSNNISAAWRWTTLSLDSMQWPLPPTMRTTDAAKLLD